MSQTVLKKSHLKNLQSPKRKKNDLKDFLLSELGIVIVDVIDISIDKTKFSISKFVNTSWVKKQMTNNLTKIYYKKIEKHGVGLGDLVEVLNLMFVPVHEYGANPAYIRLSPGEKFLLLGINFVYDYENENVAPGIWIEILHEGLLKKIDAFSVAKCIKENSLKKLM